MLFVWDDKKRRTNLKDHDQIDFETAKLVFRDPTALDFIDDRFAYSEERSIIIGRAGQRLLAVVYTMRSDITRIISARKATRQEADEYAAQFTQ